MNQLQVIPNPEYEEPPIDPNWPEQRYVADHLKSDPRAWLRFDYPMICLEYNGDEFEEVASFLPDPRKDGWVIRELYETGFDPIIESYWLNYPHIHFYRDVTEGYAPGYRIWVTVQAHGVKTWTDYGYEYDLDWEVDVLWEDRPSWNNQVKYITELCLEVLGGGRPC